MRILVAFLLLLLISSATPVAQEVPVDARQDRSSSKAQPVSVSTDSLSCTRFEWISSAISDKSGMLVRISLDEKQYIYQLDTGADDVISYGSAMQEGWSRHGEAIRIPDVRFAGMSFSSVLGYQMAGIRVLPNSKEPHGTVGLELLLGRTFILDFPKQRVCLLERGDLPESLEFAADWSSAEIRHGKLYVDLELNGKKLDGVIYDTGASAFELDVDLTYWKEATGKSGTKDASIHFDTNAWGRTMKNIGAPATGSLKIGRHVYLKPMITTEPDRPDLYKNNFWGQGSIGNALFTGSIVIST